MKRMPICDLLYKWRKEEVKEKYINYDVYVMNYKERIFYSIQAMVFIWLVSYVFYRSYPLSCAAAILGFFYPKYKIKALINKRKDLLNMQFKELLYSLSSSLSAGRSLETAMREAYKDLSFQYPDTKTLILIELRGIVHKLELNETIEEVLSEFAERTGIDNIQNFSQVVAICIKTGGNMVEVIRNTSNIICDKIDMKQEIDTLLSQRKFEQKVLSIMPVGIILMLSLGAKEYMEPIYTLPIGKAAMTVCLLLLCLSYIISNKIMDIRL